ncbi:dpcd protein [Obelidium mucronatum]|nr:dpcd protein [Obelidium mucronatum]
MISSTSQKKEASFTSDNHQPVSVVRDGKRIVHSLLPDGSEQIEEFDTKSNLLLTRKYRKKSIIGKEGPWIYEVGQEPVKEAAVKKLFDEISESAGAPQVSRKDTLKEFVFRIRNLSYPLEVYNVTIEGSQIVVRTTNKKYFTRLSISDLERISYKTLQPSALSVCHKSDTLIITYQKPKEIIEKEESERMLRQQEVSKSKSNPAVDKIDKINDECKTQ